MKISRPDAGLPQAAWDAIRHAFGARRPDAIEPVGGGLSGAGAFRLEVSGRSYLLKVERPPDGFNDPARQYACLGPAAEAGLAPRLLFADAALGVAITDFIQARPLHEHSGGRVGLLEALADLVGRLQELPPFPPLVDFPEGVGLLLARAAALGGLSPSEADQAGVRLAELDAGLDWGEGGLVASHNDLNPRNILFDGQRLWLVDWEAAFRNDAFADLAVLANFFAGGEAEERALMRRYLGRDPTAAETARLFLARQLCRLYYATVLIASAAPGRSAATAEGPDLSSPEGRSAYGRTMLEEMLRLCRAPAYSRALARA